jgi:hypothetical protein
MSKYGAGQVKDSLNYLVGKDGDRPEATVLAGNLAGLQDICDSLPYAKNYTMGVCSFEESDIPHAQKLAVMRGLEATLFAGLDQSEYEIIWVEHRDKGRLELNFVAANVHLPTGLSLTPYYHGADLRRVDAWKDITNVEYGFSDPNAPDRSRAVQIPKDLPKGKKAIHELIDAVVIEQIEGGACINRADVLDTIQQLGFTIERTTPTSISVKPPAALGDTQNVRLKGDIYRADFDGSEGASERLAARQSEYEQAATERLRQARSDYARLCAVKCERNAGRYQRPDQIDPANSLESLADSGVQPVAGAAAGEPNSPAHNAGGDVPGQSRQTAQNDTVSDSNSDPISRDSHSNNEPNTPLGVDHDRARSLAIAADRATREDDYRANPSPYDTIAHARAGGERAKAVIDARAADRRARAAEPPRPALSALARAIAAVSRAATAIGDYVGRATTAISAHTEARSRMIAQQAMQRQQEAAERAQNAKLEAYRRTLVSEDVQKRAIEPSAGFKRRDGGELLGFDEQGRAYVMSSNEKITDPLSAIPAWAVKEAGITADMIGKYLDVEVAVHPSARERRDSPSKIVSIRDSHANTNTPKPNNDKGFEL